MFTLPKIIALIFGLIVISKTFIDYRTKQENWPTFLFWLVVWAGVIFVAFDPMIISTTINHLGDKSFSLGQIIGTGFIFILFIVYRVYIKANRLEKQINQLVRKIALRDLKKKK